MENSLEKEFKRNELDYLKMIKDAYTDLIEINDTFTNVKIDFIQSGHSSYDGFLWQKEVIDEYKLFITYLGFLDANILQFQNDLEICDKDESINLKNKILKLLNTRKRIIQEINNHSHINCFPTNLDSMNEILNTVPSMDKFNVLYNNSKMHRYFGNLELEFINSYNKGFMQLGFINEEIFESTYNLYFKNLINHKISNIQKIEQAKILKNRAIN